MDVEKLGKTIAYLRKRAGYTQKELAERIGISDKAVSKWERGQGLPEIGYLRKLSILLDTDSDSLLAGDVAHHRSGWKGIIVLEENPYGIGAGTVIYDKPLIYFLLSYFLLVGIKEICLVCTPSDSEYINRSLGTGADYGITITTITGGMKYAAEMISASKEDRGSIMLLYGRTILYGVDQTRFFQKAMADRSHLTMLALPKKMKNSALAMDVDKKIVNDRKNIHASCIRTQYDFSEIPILFFPETLLHAISEADSIRTFIEEQKKEESIYVELLDRGFVDIEVNDWNNVQEASMFLKIVQDKCGMNVYCLEEVAWRRGMISLGKLKELGLRQAGTEYGDYVLSLHERLSGRVIKE